MSFNESFFAALAFFLLFALVGRSIYQAVMGKLDSKISKISSDIEEAARLKREAEEYLEKCKKLHMDAKSQAVAIIEHAEKECERLRQIASGKIEVLRVNEEKSLQDRIALLEKQAIADIEKKAIEIALLASERIISESMTNEQDEDHLDYTIKRITMGS